MWVKIRDSDEVLVGLDVQPMHLPDGHSQREVDSTGYSGTGPFVWDAIANTLVDDPVGQLVLHKADQVEVLRDEFMVALRTVQSGAELDALVGKKATGETAISAAVDKAAADTATANWQK